MPLLLVMCTVTAGSPPEVLSGMPVSLTSDTALPAPVTGASAATAAWLAFAPVAETEASNEEAAAAAEDNRAEAEATAEAALDASADGGSPENPALPDASADASDEAAAEALLDPPPELPHADRPASAPAATSSAVAVTNRARPAGAVARP